MASQKSAAGSSESNSDYDEEQEGLDDDSELDFFSSNFNPKRALLAPSINVPFKNVKTFTSIKSYEEAVRRQAQAQAKRTQPQSLELSKQPQPSTDVQHSSGSSKDEHLSGDTQNPQIGNPSFRFGDGSASFRDHSRSRDKSSEKKQSRILRVDLPESANLGGRTPFPRSKELSKPALFEFAQKKEQSILSQARQDWMKPSGSKPKQRSKRDRNVLSRMAEMSGPLHLLTRCSEQRLHVRVMTRGATLVRSICRGYIVAFDKHLNMALIDVDEIYRRPAVLGKVRARRSHKLKAAQKVLKEERDEQAKQFQEFLRKEKVSGLCGEDSNEPTCGEAIKSTSQQELNKPFSENISQPSLVTTSPVLKKKSVYEGLTEAILPFEREALMLGIADENVEYRHVNQLLIRGENVVLVSIIND